ncbi:SRPBCC family protein [uncultured Shewanella sp.]|uniref:SRPBCC family protein n=1 Tax=uncultured Shewanella sp. TaxID=173975 RepID=UPI00260B23D9|nr:SRPBCC family protein [uncultured Shewanella sp.]
MASITKRVLINAPIHQVYDYVTTPNHWPILFYPWSIKTEPYLQKPLSPEYPSIDKQPSLLERKNNTTWTPEINGAPHYLLAYGESPFLFGIRGYVRYDLASKDQQTYFTRTLFYAFDHDFIDFIFGHFIHPYFSYISYRYVNKAKQILDFHHV